MIPPDLQYLVLPLQVAVSTYLCPTVRPMDMAFSVIGDAGSSGSLKVLIERKSTGEDLAFVKVYRGAELVSEAVGTSKWVEKLAPYTKTYGVLIPPHIFDIYNPPVKPIAALATRILHGSDFSNIIKAATIVDRGNSQLRDSISSALNSVSHSLALYHAIMLEKFLIDKKVDAARIRDDVIKCFGEMHKVLYGFLGSTGRLVRAATLVRVALEQNLTKERLELIKTKEDAVKQLASELLTEDKLKAAYGFIVNDLRKIGSNYALAPWADEAHMNLLFTGYRRIPSEFGTLISAMLIKGLDMKSMPGNMIIHGDPHVDNFVVGVSDFKEQEKMAEHGIRTLRQGKFDQFDPTKIGLSALKGNLISMIFDFDQVHNGSAYIDILRLICSISVLYDRMITQDKKAYKEFVDWCFSVTDGYGGGVTETLENMEKVKHIEFNYAYV